MNEIRIDPERTISDIDPNIFGGFAEHLGRCIYGGVYEPDSPHADENGLRTDVLAALKRLRLPVIRYPGGNFASGYRWKDGIGPVEDRPARMDLAWESVESNRFGTNEFVTFCRKLDSEPYLVVNCGDGDMREARDWVEYCNGTRDTDLVKLRRNHGFEQPHRVKYWGIGNEVDGPWQTGFKTPQEYARAYTEFAKVMKWTDPDIKLIASALSLWSGEIVERAQLLVEQASQHLDYMGLHWYVGNPDNNFNAYMATSELIEERLSSYEGLLRALCLERKLEKPIPIAVDEWNVWYRTRQSKGVPTEQKLEEKYNLEDALVVAMHFNAFIRHSRSVRMANIAQIVNVIAPVFTRPDCLFLQTIFHPFEVYASTCGTTALDVWWQGDTFSGGNYMGVRTLDVSATIDESGKQLVVYAVNRSATEPQEAEIRLITGSFGGNVRVLTVNGPDIKSENSFETPDEVNTRETTISAEGQSLTYTFEPHSVTALIANIS
jgi:alpha-N-arabinofuranosidase